MRDGLIPLREVSEIQTGPFGSQLHAADYVPNGTPIITVEHLIDNRVGHEDIPLVNEADATRLSRYRLEAGDLVFSRVGAIDRCALVTPEEHDWLFSGRLLRVRPARSKVEPTYLAQVLIHEPMRRWIRNHAVGSTMACLNTSILGGTPVHIPPLTEQRRIAEILDTVDSAIRSTERLIAKLNILTSGWLDEVMGQFAPTTNDSA